MAAPIPPMLKCSVVYSLLNFPPILIRFVSKFIVCKVLYFKAQCFLRLRSPLITHSADPDQLASSEAPIFKGRVYLGSAGQGLRKKISCNRALQTELILCYLHMPVYTFTCGLFELLSLLSLCLLIRYLLRIVIYL